MLRKWQSECVDLAIEHYIQVSPIFFALLPLGLGKPSWRPN